MTPEDFTRRGRFSIADSLIKADLESMQMVMARCVVLSCQKKFGPTFGDEVLEYLAISSDFDDLEEGDIIPTYTWVFERDSISGDREVYAERWP